VSLFLKRVFDIICATAGLALLSPLLLWIAFRIKQEDDGPVFYRGCESGASREAFSHFQVPDYGGG